MKKTILIILLPYIVLRHREFLFNFGFRSFFNTIRFNFKLFPLKEALLFPIYVTSNYKIKELQGKVVIKNGVSKGLIQFGVFEIGIYNKHSDKGIIDIKSNGILIFDGKASFGVGCKLSVNENATLEIGSNFTVTAATTIICYNHIKIGNNCLFSWHVLLMDSDMHTIYPILKKSHEILIKDSIWIGCNTTILKGSFINSNSVIGAQSLVNKSFKETNILIAGNPARCIKTGISWK
jgi:acetyltransferase-like isoleucine patch superfamily enzyme